MVHMIKEDFLTQHKSIFDYKWTLSDALDS